MLCLSEVLPDVLPASGYLLDIGRNHQHVCELADRYPTIVLAEKPLRIPKALVLQADLATALPALIRGFGCFGLVLACDPPDDWDSIRPYTKQIITNQGQVREQIRDELVLTKGTPLHLVTYVNQATNKVHILDTETWTCSRSRVPYGVPPTVTPEAFVHGITLGDLIRLRARTSLLPILDSLVNKVFHLQDLGVTHGNINPDTVLWEPTSGEVYLVGYNPTRTSHWVDLLHLRWTLYQAFRKQTGLLRVDDISHLPGAVEQQTNGWGRSCYTISDFKQLLAMVPGQVQGETAQLTLGSGSGRHSYHTAR